MRTRANYGIIGAAQTLSVTSTGGVYSVDDQRIAKLAFVWPGDYPLLTVNGTLNNIGLLGPSYQLSYSTNGFYTLSSNKTSTFRIQLWGGGGGTGPSSTPGQGGAGGYVEGNVTLQSGVSYIFLIGAGGAQGGSSRAFPDGGYATGDASIGGAGGGSSRFGLQGSITNSAASYNNTSVSYYLIAGGGGGSTNWAAADGGGHTVEAGYGGGTSGSAGGAFYSADGSSTLGGGGTQSAGGTAGTGGRTGGGGAGAKYAGGNGYGCGGGGGYYGGGGAAGFYSQSGGGSGYIDSGNVASGTFYTASTGANNYVSPNPRTNKPSTAGNGGLLLSGKDGAIILTWLGY